MNLFYSPLKLSATVWAAIFLIIISSCSDDDVNVNEPVIQSFAPASALPGASVTISGAHFSTTLSGNQVSFNSVAATVTSATATALTVTVPETATTGKITVTVNGKTATSSGDFTVLQTTLAGFSPESGREGTTVTITGTHFSPTPSENIVEFNGVEAPVTGATASELTVTVPETATTGKITVTVNGKTVTSSTDFAVLQTTITGFSPESGTDGATVTITGTNFSTVLSDNIVEFNGAAATVSAATSTELTVTVPAGATSGKITVTISGTTATSAADFAVLQTTITGFSPESGTDGATVTITGTNFSTVLSDNIVEFNGAAATVSAATSTELTVTVPAGATTGKITVTIHGKATTSATDFTVPPPTIVNYFPAIAAPGISVTITGTNFSSIAANNIVKFNGVDATVTAASSTALTVTVPAGATTGALTVKVGLATATGSGDFEICSGAAELVISDVIITNIGGATSYNVSFKVTNAGAADADMAKMVMQNYASADAAVGNDLAASGYGLSSGGTLSPGQAYTFSFSASIAGGNTTSHPYLIITVFDTPDGSVQECNFDNNIVIKPFN